MKLGNVSRPNSKGQIVIPKEFRDKLGIDQSVLLQMIVRGNGLYIKPVHGIVNDTDSEDSYEKILDKTRGVWSKDSLEMEKKLRKLELKATSMAKTEEW